MLFLYEDTIDGYDECESHQLGTNQHEDFYHNEGPYKNTVLRVITIQ